MDGRTLFEAPPSALMMLHRAGIDPNDIEYAPPSHHHGDHFLGSPSWPLHWKYTERTRPVTIAGPPGTEELAKQIGTAADPGLFDAKVEIDWVTMRPGASLRRGDLEVEGIEVEHDDRLGLSLGFACRFNGRRLGYTGDSRLCDGVLDLARTSEVLVCECASRDARIPIHMNLVDDMPEVRAAMQGDAQLILTHLT
ncbi:MAG: MBL fold metallo-hydrolase [Dehalococcoidia bacterium]|nr:MBL fold metallo-hydrolase [Dehalococcoidia bacterium]